MKCQVCNGYGWRLITAEEPDLKLSIQHCYGCKVFESDNEALEHVNNRAKLAVAMLETIDLFESEAD